MFVAVLSIIAKVETTPNVYQLMSRETNYSTMKSFLAKNKDEVPT